MNNTIIGNKIKSRRLELEMTQKELANSLGKTVSSIQKYEKGTTEIPLSVLYEMADVLDCDIFDFLTDEKYITHVITVDDAIINFFSQLGYDVFTTKEAIQKNGYTYSIPGEEILSLLDDVRFSSQDKIDELLKEYRTTRKRI